VCHRREDEGGEIKGCMTSHLRQGLAKESWMIALVHYTGLHGTARMAQATICRLHYKCKGGRLDVCDVIFERGPEQLYEMFRKGEVGYFFPKIV